MGVGGNTADDELTVVLFRCGHVYHTQCLDNAGVHACYICQPGTAATSAQRKSRRQTAEPATFSLRELMQAQQMEQGGGRRGGAGAAGHLDFASLSHFDNARLNALKASTTRPSRLDMLEQIQDYLEGEGAPPMPSGALSAEESFRLNRRAPRQKVSAGMVSMGWFDSVYSFFSLFRASVCGGEQACCPSMRARRPRQTLAGSTS